MILANGCSHTHGTNHAVLNNYADKLWPNIAGKMLGDTNVVNLAKGGDSAGAIADSTIHWMETNTIKPDMVMIQWTYADRFDIPYHRLYADDPFRDGCFVDNIRLGIDPPYSDKFTYLNQYPREGMIRLTSTGGYLSKDESTGMLKRIPDLMAHLGLKFPNILYQAGYKQNVHPYYLENHEDEHMQEIIEYYKRYVDYREAYLNLPTAHNELRHKWAMAQNHVAAYCEANDIPYYWWGTDVWYQPKFADLMYLKPKTGHEMFANLGFIDQWLERQGIIANGDAIEGDISEEEVAKNPNLMQNIDDHRGEDGHKFIGEMVGNFIKHGIEPDQDDINKELLKANILSRPNLTLENDATGLNQTGGDNNRKEHYEALLRWCNSDEAFPGLGYRSDIYAATKRPWRPQFYYD